MCVLRLCLSKTSESITKRCRDVTDVMFFRSLSCSACIFSVSTATGPYLCVVFVLFCRHCGCLYRFSLYKRDTAKLIVLSSAVAVSLLELIVHYYHFVTVRDEENIHVP